MFDPQFLFQNPRILRFLPYKQPDLSKPESRQKARDSVEKKRPLYGRVTYFFAFFRACSAKA